MSKYENYHETTDPSLQRLLPNVLYMKNKWQKSIDIWHIKSEAYAWRENFLRYWSHHLVSCGEEGVSSFLKLVAKYSIVCHCFRDNVQNQKCKCEEMMERKSQLASGLAWLRKGNAKFWKAAQWSVNKSSDSAFWAIFSALIIDFTT